MVVTKLNISFTAVNVCVLVVVVLTFAGVTVIVVEVVTAGDVTTT